MMLSIRAQQYFHICSPGYCKARDLRKEKYSVVAVIGDGALTGGMAFEALNDAGRSPNNLIVVLNDNEMSIRKM